MYFVFAVRGILCFVCVCFGQLFYGGRSHRPSFFQGICRLAGVDWGKLLYAASVCQAQAQAQAGLYAALVMLLGWLRP